jgi:hypothetical protein
LGLHRLRKKAQRRLYAAKCVLQWLKLWRSRKRGIAGFSAACSPAYVPPAWDWHLLVAAEFGTFGPFKGNILRESASRGLAGGKTGLNLEARNITERRRMKACESNAKLRYVFLR